MSVVFGKISVNIFSKVENIDVNESQSLNMKTDMEKNSVTNLDVKKHLKLRGVNVPQNNQMSFLNMKISMEEMRPINQMLPKMSKFDILLREQIKPCKLILQNLETEKKENRHQIHARDTAKRNSKR